MRVVMELLACDAYVIRKLVSARELGYWRPSKHVRRRFFKVDAYRIAGLPFDWEEVTLMPALMPRKEFAAWLGLDDKALRVAVRAGWIRPLCLTTGNVGGMRPLYRRIDALRIAGHPLYTPTSPDSGPFRTQSIDSASTVHFNMQMT